MTELGRIERQAYNTAVKTVIDKQQKGIRAHTKRIRCREGMKQAVKMYRWVEFDNVFELKSEPFDILIEAQHFSECFNDNFLYDSYCEEIDGKFYVFTGWILKDGFLSYSVCSKGEFFEFSNWS